MAVAASPNSESRLISEDTTNEDPKVTQSSPSFPHSIDPETTLLESYQQTAAKFHRGGEYSDLDPACSPMLLLLGAQAGVDYTDSSDGEMVPPATRIPAPATISVPEPVKQPEPMVELVQRIRQRPSVIGLFQSTAHRPKSAHSTSHSSVQITTSPKLPRSHSENDFKTKTQHHHSRRRDSWQPQSSEPIQFQVCLLDPEESETRDSLSPLLNSPIGDSTPFGQFPPQKPKFIKTSHSHMQLSVMQSDGFVNHPPSRHHRPSSATSEPSTRESKRRIAPGYISSAFPTMLQHAQEQADHYKLYYHSTNAALLKSKVDPKANQKHKVLHTAEKKHDNSHLVGDLFKKNDVRPNQGDTLDRTPLHYAALSKQMTPQIVTALLAQQERLTSKDKHGYTPWQYALMHQTAKIMPHFIQNLTLSYVSDDTVLEVIAWLYATDNIALLPKHLLSLKELTQQIHAAQFLYSLDSQDLQFIGIISKFWRAIAQKETL